MTAQRAMARLTGDNHVLALLFLIYDVGMAALANVVAGKRDRPGRSLRNGSTAIVPVLSKAARNDSRAQNDESDYCYGYDDSKPDEVFDVLKQCRLSAPDSRRTGAPNCAMLFDT